MQSPSSPPRNSTPSAPTITLYNPGEEENQFIGICIFGNGGAGKTSLLRTMPGRGLVVDIPQIEGGTMVLGDQKPRIKTTRVTAWAEIENVYNFLQHGQHDFQWVAIDSVTAMQELAKRKTIGDRPRQIVSDPHTITLQEHGKVGRLVGELVYKFRTLPLHVIWIAQERKFGNDEGLDGAGLNMIGPDVSPSALGMLKPSLMLVGRLSVERNLDGQQERRLRIGPNERYHTKYRALPTLQVPPVIVEPNLGQILLYLFTGKGEPPKAPKEPPAGAIIVTAAR